MKTRSNDIIAERKQLDIEISESGQVVICESDQEVHTFSDVFGSYKHNCAKIKNSIIIADLNIVSGGDEIAFEEDNRVFFVFGDQTTFTVSSSLGYTHFSPAGSLANIKVFAQFFDHYIVYTVQAAG